MPALASWPRSRYQPGGGNARLHYVVVGQFVNPLPSMSSSFYRSAGMPAEMTLVHYSAEHHAATLSGLRSGPLWDALAGSASAETVQAALAAVEAVVLRAEIPDPPDLDYLRDTVGLVTYLLDFGGVAVLDPLRLQLWGQREWREHVFLPAEPVPHQHVLIVRSEEPDPQRSWFHTRGLRKFGRPDLSVHHVRPRYGRAVIELIDRFIQLLAHGGIIPEGQEIKMAQLPPGLTCHHGGRMDDPAFDNVHVEVVGLP
jgi:hypothetical protein